MYRPPQFVFSHLRAAVLAIAGVALMSTALWGEQTHVTRFDVFAGSSTFTSPAISLVEQGVHIQIGVRPKQWYSIGFDYSNVSGDLTLTPELLPNTIQANLQAQLGRLVAAGLLSPGYKLAVSADSHTQTFTVGPQLAYRRWTKVTLFARPSCGLIREVAKPTPSDAVARSVVAQLAPEGEKLDWTPFYGAGGGMDINFGPFFALRIQADYVWDHLFPDVLKSGRNTLRFSVGPAINFGPNIIRH